MTKIQKRQKDKKRKKRKKGKKTPKKDKRTTRQKKPKNKKRVEHCDVRAVSHPCYVYTKERRAWKGERLREITSFWSRNWRRSMD